MDLPQLRVPFSLHTYTTSTPKSNFLNNCLASPKLQDLSTTTTLNPQSTLVSPQVAEDTSGAYQSLCSDDDVSDFPQSLYDRIEEFLDQEKLHIICPQTPNGAKPTKLKVCPNLQRLRSLCGSAVLSTDSTNDSVGSISDEELKNVAMPSFLLKRTMSSNCVDRPNRPGLGNLTIKRGVNSEMNTNRSKFLVLKSLAAEEEPHGKC